jgi:hypothetical protein
VKRKAMMRLMTKKREGAVSETEKLLTMSMDTQIQEHVAPSSMAIQAKARNFFEDLFFIIIIAI